MGPIDYFFSFKGRLARLDYWKLIFTGLLISCAFVIADFLSVFLMTSGAPSEAATDKTFWPTMLIAAIFYWSVASACVRRLHDLDRSGWWALLVLIVPFWGVLFIGCVPGDRGLKNRFGPDPLKRYGKVPLYNTDNDLQRLSEIRDIAEGLNSPDAFFQGDDDKFSNPNKRSYFVELERDLQGLDIPAWNHLKNEIHNRLTQRIPLRGWQPLIDILNEAKGYNYLRSIGCSNVEFIPRSKGKTPDLRAMLGDSKVLCDVKTINISQDEAQRRASGGVGTSKEYLTQEFFNKLSNDIETKSSQMKAFDPDTGIRRMIYFVINTDDSLNEYADDHRTQIETFLSNVTKTDIEIVLDIKSSFSAIRVKAHSSSGRQ